MPHVEAAEIRRILAATDGVGIHREAVSIPLLRRDPGGVRVTPAGRLEIVVPAQEDFESWLAGLPAALAALDRRALRPPG